MEGSRSRNDGKGGKEEEDERMVMIINKVKE